MFEVLKNMYAKLTLQSCNRLMNSRCKIIKTYLLNELLLQCLNNFFCQKRLISRIYKSKIKQSQKAEVTFLFLVKKLFITLFFILLFVSDKN